MTKEERATSARLLKEQIHAKKLHTIAERRARAAKLDKADFIAAIVRGEFKPITAEDIRAEPTPL
jgi:hypothetical protein